MSFDDDEVDVRTPIGKLLKPRTSREIRLSGLAAVLVSIALYVPAIVLMSAAPELFGRGIRKITGFIFVIPYILLMVGMYRLVTGKRSEEAKQGILWSLLRISLGVMFLVVTIATLLFVIAWVSRE